MKTPDTSYRSKFQARMRAKPTAIRGIRVLRDLQGHCLIDEDTGCWIWRAGLSMRNAVNRSPIPMIWFPPEQRVTQAARAAWLVAGFDLEPGQVVFRFTCLNGLCIHPLHGAAGTRQEMNAHRAARGVYRVDAAKRAALNRARAAMMLSPAQVADIEARIQAGEPEVTRTSIARAVGVHVDTVKKIERGAHPYSRGGAQHVPGSSVFNLASAL